MLPLRWLMFVPTLAALIGLPWDRASAQADPQAPQVTIVGPWHVGSLAKKEGTRFCMVARPLGRQRNFFVSMVGTNGPSMISITDSSWKVSQGTADIGLRIGSARWQLEGIGTDSGIVFALGEMVDGGRSILRALHLGIGAAEFELPSGEGFRVPLDQATGAMELLRDCEARILSGTKLVAEALAGEGLVRDPFARR